MVTKTRNVSPVTPYGTSASNAGVGRRSDFPAMCHDGRGVVRGVLRDHQVCHASELRGIVDPGVISEAAAARIGGE